ncbi:aminoglycoside phosphotransferase family protein [Streptomyces tubbatahanensis]|uniref:Aminoglycoside phosphotransferase family protein n=1 Tax=Streptomyces tubbatahanensis TaxID=2923272 RepID=A0ABY3Y1L5_9ACTN|nr:phosphotransferase [Streptomyces tubbatahanensis]UNT00581.1 aminoglycoside phosphotransferase family protein [Streptomyces tubbatahanensis]
MDPARLRRAVEAGWATAAGLGLQVDDASVVHDSDRVALRLAPCEVLARVAPLGHLADSEFEVEVARRLAAVDAPVAELEPRVEPRVHVRDDFAVSLWTYYAPVGPALAPADYAEVFLRHHAALRRLDLEAPHFTARVAAALRQVNDRERSPELSDRDRELVSDTLGGLSSAFGDDRAGDQLLHGEPHPGNVLNTGRGPLFVDLGTCCRGPVEFDLAHAPEEVGEHYPGADHALIHRFRAVNWAMFTAWRWREDDRMPDRGRWRVEGLNRVRAALERCGRG